MDRSSFLLPTALALACAATSLAAEPAQKKVAIDLSTPQAAFETWQAAAKQNDTETLYEVQTPALTDSMLFELYFTSYFLRTQGEKKVTAIVDKYFDHKKAEDLSAKANGQQLSEEEIVKQTLSCVRDRKRLYVEGYTALGERSTDEVKFTPLRDVKMQGNIARGTTTQTVISTSWHRSKEGVEEARRTPVELDNPFFFVKTDGKWRIASVVECQPLAPAPEPLAPPGPPRAQ